MPTRSPKRQIHPAWPPPPATDGCFTFKLRMIADGAEAYQDPWEAYWQALDEEAAISRAIRQCPSCAFWIKSMTKRAGVSNRWAERHGLPSRYVVFAHPRNPHPRRGLAPATLTAARCSI